MKTIALTSILSLLSIFSFNYAVAAADQFFSIQNYPNSQTAQVTITSDRGPVYIESADPSWGCSNVNDSTIRCNSFTPQQMPDQNQIVLGLTGDINSGTVTVSIPQYGKNSWKYLTALYDNKYFQFTPTTPAGNVIFTHPGDNGNNPTNFISIYPFP